MEAGKLGGEGVCVRKPGEDDDDDDNDDDVELHVLGCRLTHQGQTVSSA